jgi:hypothetical protein
LRYNLCYGSVDALGTSSDAAVLRPAERSDGAGGLLFEGRDEKRREVLETKKKGYGELLSRV